MKTIRAVAVLLAAPALSQAGGTFEVAGADAKPWTKILGAVGMQAVAKGGSVTIAGGTAGGEAAERANGGLLILEGDSAAARRLGFAAGTERVTVRQTVDTHAPKMQIIWETPVEIAKTALPPGFTVYASERWQGVPLLAGKRTAHGAILWMATAPGDGGMERYPYLVHALADLGLEFPLRATNLWAFFDSSYRIRADAEYLARRWRAAGVGVLHVAAWHNMDGDKAQDEYLDGLIQACHRNAILVYAWIELPHVSEKFWAEHAGWREQTAAGQDAQLDWRKLMNLQNAECRKAVSLELGALLRRFDWDGVNLAELYFESLEGASNPARFTPLNRDVRAEFEKQGGFDPQLLFTPGSQHEAAKHPDDLRRFLDYRAALASNLQAQWLDEIEKTRAGKPYLDTVLTHIDDRFEPGIRDALGADIARSLPLILERKSTLLVEDPATLWNLGPERYRKLGEQYRALSADSGRFAVDVNVVERYQDVYPTKKQTGVELLELVHEAAAAFSRVALYFENSLEKQDLGLLPVAANTATVQVGVDGVMVVNAAQATRVVWQGAVEMDGQLWPVQSAQSILAPVGKHSFEASALTAGVTIADFNGEIRTALGSADRAAITYFSKSRAVAVLGSSVTRVEVDGAVLLQAVPGEQVGSVVLPAGEHSAAFYR